MNYRTLLLLGLLLLPGCQGAFDISISDASASSLTFNITPRGEPTQRPAYSTVRLLELPSKEIVWAIRASPFGTTASQSSLRYGQTPDGFKTMTASTALRSGVEYKLVVSGQEHGQLAFEINDGVAEPLED